MGKLQEGATVPTNMDIVGAPDICITSVVEPHLFSAMGENKLVKERKWRDIGKKVEKGEASREDSMIGQLYWYLLAPNFGGCKLLDVLRRKSQPFWVSTLTLDENRGHSSRRSSRILSTKITGYSKKHTMECKCKQRPTRPFHFSTTAAALCHATATLCHATATLQHTRRRRNNKSVTQLSAIPDSTVRDTTYIRLTLNTNDK